MPFTIPPFRHFPVQRILGYLKPVPPWEWKQRDGGWRGIVSDWAIVQKPRFDLRSFTFLKQ